MKPILLLILLPLFGQAQKAKPEFYIGPQLMAYTNGSQAKAGLQSSVVFKKGRGGIGLGIAPLFHQGGTPFPFFIDTRIGLNKGVDLTFRPGYNAYSYNRTKGNLYAAGGLVLKVPTKKKVGPYVSLLYNYFRYETTIGNRPAISYNTRGISFSVGVVGY